MPHRQTQLPIINFIYQEVLFILTNMKYDILYDSMWVYYFGSNMQFTTNNFKNMQTMPTMIVTCTYETLKKLKFNKFLTLCNIQFIPYIQNLYLTYTNLYIIYMYDF